MRCFQNKKDVNIQPTNYIFLLIGLSTEQTDIQVEKMNYLEPNVILFW